jgi:virulence-associated protein VagC
MTSVDMKVTSRGVLVPRPLLAAWGDVEEVEIEQREDAIIIKPKESQGASVGEQIVRQMKADGLVETLPWKQPPTVSPEKRAELAEKLSRGKPLSEVIIEGREERA